MTWSKRWYIRSRILKGRQDMAVKVRERPCGSGKWWIFIDYKGKRSARYIPQGRRVAEQVAARITEKLGLLDANVKHGFPIALHQLIVAQPDDTDTAKSDIPDFKKYASVWMEGCEARGLKPSTRRGYESIVRVHL